MCTPRRGERRLLLTASELVTISHEPPVIASHDPREEAEDAKTLDESFPRLATCTEVDEEIARPAAPPRLAHQTPRLRAASEENRGGPGRGLPMALSDNPSDPRANPANPFSPASFDRAQ
ncbi:unnamed protein product [Lampetra fluviatilis]